MGYVVAFRNATIADPSALDFIKGYNFLACSVMWLLTSLLYVVGQRDQSQPVNRIMITSESRCDDSIADRADGHSRHCRQKCNSSATSQYRNQRHSRGEQRTTCGDH